MHSFIYLFRSPFVHTNIYILQIICLFSGCSCILCAFAFTYFVNLIKISLRICICMLRLQHTHTHNLPASSPTRLYLRICHKQYLYPLNDLKIKKVNTTTCRLQGFANEKRKEIKIQAVRRFPTTKNESFFFVCVGKIKFKVLPPQSRLPFYFVVVITLTLYVLPIKIFRKTKCLTACAANICLWKTATFLYFLNEGAMT